MPSFNIIRALRRSKAASASPSPSSSPTSSTTTLADFCDSDDVFAANPRVEIGFVSLYKREGLLSLAEAQRSPDIVYHSVSHLPEPETVAEPTLPSWGAQKETTFSFISLSEAQARSDIKYRREGFEMQEHRAHILAVRADISF